VNIPEYLSIFRVCIIVKIPETLKESNTVVYNINYNGKMVMYSITV